MRSVGYVLMRLFDLTIVVVGLFAILFAAVVGIMVIFSGSLPWD